MFTSTVPTSVRQSALADWLPRKELKELDQTATIIEIAESTEIIARATHGRECFVVIDGAFGVHAPGFEASIAGGEVAGELALLTGKKRNASVVASADSSVYALHPIDFATLLSDAPEFRRRVMATAAQRVSGDEISLPAQYVRRR